MQSTAIRLRPSPETAQTGAQVVIIDASLVFRGLTSRWLSELPEIADVVTFSNADSILRRADLEAPDIIVLDIEMDDTNGFSVLQALHSKFAQTKILVLAARQNDSAVVAQRVKKLGAQGILTKPVSMSKPEESRAFKSTFTMSVLTLAQRGSRSSSASRPNEARRAARPAAPVATTRATVSARAPAATGESCALRPFSRYRPRILAIGGSTGGPPALMDLICQMPPGPHDVPIVVVQHMPDAFTVLLADHIAKKSKRDCRRPENGETITSGTVYIAPGDLHLKLESQNGEIKARLYDGPSINFCKPAVDPLFESVAAIYKAETLAVMLTGMGHDGLEGSRAIVEQGGTLLAQDEASSVVWGMPGAVARAGLCSAVVPVSVIASSVTKLLRGERVS